MVEARAVVEARTVGALVNVDVTVPARPARLADASVVAHQVRAGRRVDSAQRRRQLTFVHVRLAVPPFESGRAEAGVIGQAVDARGAVETRAEILALVDLLATIQSAESRAGARALEAVDQVGAGPVVPARIRQAIVDVDAGNSGESVETEALVRVRPRGVDATRMGWARDVGAVVDFRLATRTAETRKAQAFDSALDAAAADSVVEARVRLANGGRQHGRIVSQHLGSFKIGSNSIGFRWAMMK